jgi:hypothetical protein
MMTFSLGRRTSAGNRPSIVPAEERVVGEVPPPLRRNALAGEVHCDFLLPMG